MFIHIISIADNILDGDNIRKDDIISDNKRFYLNEVEKKE